MVIGHGGVGEAVEFGEAVYIIPHFLVVGVENVGAIDVDIDALDLLAVHIAGDMIPLVDDQHGLARSLCLLSEHSAVQTRAHHQIIIVCHGCPPYFLGNRASMASRAASCSARFLLLPVP